MTIVTGRPDFRQVDEIPGTGIRKANEARNKDHAVQILSKLKVGGMTGILKNGSAALNFTAITGQDFLDALLDTVNTPAGTKAISFNTESRNQLMEILTTLDSVDANQGVQLYVNYTGDKPLKLEGKKLNEVKISDRFTVNLTGNIKDTRETIPAQQQDTGAVNAQASINNAVSTVQVVSGRASVTAENIADYVTRFEAKDRLIRTITDLDVSSLNPATVVDLLHGGLINPDLKNLDILLPYAAEMKGIESFWADITEAQDGPGKATGVNINVVNPATFDGNILNSGSEQERLADLEANYPQFFDGARAAAKAMIDPSYIPQTIDVSADIDYPKPIDISTIASTTTNSNPTDPNTTLVKAKNFNEFHKAVLNNHSGENHAVVQLMNKIAANKEVVTLKEFQKVTGLSLHIVGKNDEYDSSIHDSASIKPVKGHIIYNDDNGKLAIATTDDKDTNLIGKGQRVAFVADVQGASSTTPAAKELVTMKNLTDIRQIAVSLNGKEGRPEIKQLPTAIANRLAFSQLPDPVTVEQFEAATGLKIIIANKGDKHNATYTGTTISKPGQHYITVAEDDNTLILIPAKNGHFPRREAKLDDKNILTKGQKLAFIQDKAPESTP